MLGWFTLASDPSGDYLKSDAGEELKFKMTQTYIAKINPPRVTHVYPRDRLFKTLDQSPVRPAVWISGPPGSGKTTLAASYLTIKKQSPIWYQIDSGDKDTATFFYYLRLAVEKAARRKHPDLPLLTSEYLMDVAAFTRGYFRKLWERLAHPVVLVFDNYQEIGEETPFHDMLCVELMQIPEGSRVIFISRNEPPAAFARLRASQTITRIDRQALQFTREETNGLITLRKEDKIPKATREVLYRQTEGWAAGIILMLDQIKTQGGIVTTQKTDGAVFDYFLKQVLSQVPAAVFDFLLRSAFLPSLTVRMAEQVAGTPAGFAEKTLKSLSRQQFFITSHSDGVYRYNDLFRAFLVAHASKTFTPDDLTQIRNRAAVLLEEAGQFEEAIELFRETNNWPGIIRIILKNAPSMLMQGRYKTLHDWISSLRREMPYAHPWLLYWWGYGSQPFNLARSRELFIKSYRLFESQIKDKDTDASLGLFSAWCGIIETFIFECGDFKGIDPWIALMEEKLASQDGFPSHEIEARVVSNMAFALTFRQPDHPDIGRWVERSLTLVAGMDRPDIKVRAINSAALYYSFVGDWAKMGRLIDLLELGNDAKVNKPSFEMLGYYLVQAIYYWTSGLPGRCIDCVEKGLAVAQTSGVHMMDHPLLFQGLYASLSTGDLQKSAVFLKAMGALFSESKFLSAAQYYYLVAWEAWLKSDLPKAIEFSRKGLEMAIQAGTPFFEALCRLGLVQALLTQGDVAIHTHLKKVNALARKMKGNVLISMSLLLEAQQKLVQGDEKGIMVPLKEALHLGKGYGHCNIPWWNAKVMAKLFVIALEQGIEVEYVQRVIQRQNIYPDSSPLTVPNWPWPIKIFTLGQTAILKEDKPIQSKGKTQKKPLELLYTLAAFGRQGAGEAQLTESLWPMAEGDKAHLALEITINRLRRFLGQNEAIQLQEGWYKLSERHCWVDAWALEQLFIKIEAALQQMPNEIRKQEIDHLSAKIHVLYKGDFLGHGASSQVVLYRERLHIRYLRCVRGVGAYWEKAGEWEKAETSYQKGLDLDPRAELLVQRLMTLYQKLGRQAEAMMVYQRCKKILLATLEVEPSDETKRIYRSLRSSSS